MSYTDEYYAQTPGPGQKFGAPRDNGKRTHQGADFSHSREPGTIPVPLVTSGVVTDKFYSSGYGNRLEVGAWSYSHLEEASPLRVGVWYPAGTIVGYEGDSGATNGPCMHLEYVAGGRKVDPVPIVRALLSGSPAVIPKPPVTPANRKLVDMFLFAVRGSFYFATSRGIVGVRNPAELELLREMLDFTPGKEVWINEAQRDVVNYYLTAPVLTWADLNP